jgi:hypothetical protein
MFKKRNRSLPSRALPALLLAAALQAFVAPALAASAADPALLGHWTFDGGSGKNAASANFPASISAPLKTAPGVFGDAAVFAPGKTPPSISVSPGVLPEGIRQLTFSAWVAPRVVQGIIFRKEDTGRHGDNRLLFALQNGKFLTLGLNCGGNYAELDALVSPDELADGRWHHVAGTFDGKTMRAFLDGREIGSFERQVPLTTVHDYAPLRIDRDAVAHSNYASLDAVTVRGVPLYIGAMDGKADPINGKLDDARFYARALSAAQIAALYAEGQPAATAAAAPVLAAKATAAALYKKAASFNATLDALDKAVAAAAPGTAAPSPALAVELQRLLRDDFPEDVNAYVVKWQRNPVDHVFLGQPARRAIANSLVSTGAANSKNPAPAFEYLPLTDFQWAALSKTERAKWERAKALKAQLANPALPVAAEWLFELEDLINTRPMGGEPVARHVAPATPATRDRTPAEARAVIEKDWLFQAGGKPTIARAVEEIGYARALLNRLNLPAADTTAYTAKLDNLAAQATAAAAAEAKAAAEALAAANTAASGTEASPAASAPAPAAAPAPNPAALAAAKSLYIAVRTVKREIVLKNPVLDFDSILYIDNPHPGGRESNHETRHRLGYMAVPGGRLLVQKGLSPDGKLSQLLPQAPLHGTFWRPDLSYDATKVLVSYKPHNEKTFHIYEIGLDGTGFRQLTGGMFDDFDPVYLPDQKNILFTTTRGYIYVRCMPPTNAMVTARMSLDTKPGDKTIYITSRNGEPEYTPSVLDNGRVIYTRWEYTDKPLWRAQSLWTMNQDTTRVETFWGNQSVWPDLLKDARSIPGSNRVMFTGSAHHNWFAGSVGIIDPSKGMNFPHGLTKVTQELEWPESRNGPTDPKESATYHTSGRYTAYYSPYPLSEKDFLVSASRAGKWVLLLMDTDGNREIINEGAHHIWDAIPVRKRPVPRAMPDQVDWPTWATRETPGTGTLYSNNVYEGVPELKDKAKFLRIWSIEHKTYTYWDKRNYVSSGPEVSVVSSEGVKKIIGTVPIEADGSVYFNAPSGIALHFQLLDEKQRALQTMKSFTGVHPGELRGCVGCHEKQMNAPVANPSTFTKAKAFARGKPSSITPVPWEDITVGYERYVQPALDKYCGSCHADAAKPAYRAFNSKLRPGFLGFKEPYMTLLGSPTWGGNYKVRKDTGNGSAGGFGWADTIMVESFSTVAPAAYATYPAMTRLSYVSRLVKRLSGEKVGAADKHPRINADPESLLRVIHWVDAMGPYNGAEEVRKMEDPRFVGKDWISQPPRIHTAPIVQRPGPFDAFHPDEDPAYFPPTADKYNALPYGVKRTTAASKLATK